MIPIPDHPTIRSMERTGYARRQRAVCQCSECDEPIYEGESAYNLPKWGWVCETCMNNSYKVVD